MTKITPRWEWRAFGPHFGIAEMTLRALDAGGVQESDEVYLLAGPSANVKIRDKLMDIKLLQAVDSDGLQQWRPVMKAGFPLSPQDAARVVTALGLPAPGVPRAQYDLDAILHDFTEPRSPVRVVTVHKTRTRYTIGGCSAELSDVVANGKRTRTIAVEATDAAAVMRAVVGLGLGGWANTSYPKGLAALIVGAPERYAVIDVGTNSIKFHIAERQADGAWRSVCDFAEVTRLGEGMADTGRIGDAAIRRAVAAIAGMAERAAREGVRALAAVGTAGLRIASNRDEVIAAIRAGTGVRVEVISGEDEARLAYLAAREGLDPWAGKVVVFDTGGGSSQFTFGQDGRIDERFSVDVGAARMTERFGLDRAVSQHRIAEALAAIRADLVRLAGRPEPAALIGMGGALTNITAVRHGLVTYDPSVVQGTVLDRDEIDRQIELYRLRDAEARRSIAGLQPKRAEVILAGACIVRCVMELLGKRSLTVSDRGLRHGVLAERFGPAPVTRCEVRPASV